MDSHLIWLLFGKVPVLISLSIFAYISARRVGYLRATWAFSALCVALSIGVSLLPSILGAVGAGILALLLLLTYLSPQKWAWTSVIWPLMVSILSIIIIGRMGCWLSACCFGEVTHLPWATHYTHQGFIASYHLDRYGDLASNGPLPVHPVQLYESLGTVLLLGGICRLKSRIGELRGALLLGGGYLGLYAVLNPLRAYLNTQSSIVFWGPFSQLQWSLLTLFLMALFLAKRLKQTDKLQHTLAKEPLILSVKTALILWGILMSCGIASVYLGTPFSAELSTLGMCLSVVALLQSLAMYECSVFGRERIFTPLIFHTPFKGIILLFTIPLCLLPLVIVGMAIPHDPFSASSPRTWVYKLEPTQQKVVRLGQARQILRPMTAVEIQEVEDVDLVTIKGGESVQQQPLSRWIIQGGIASGEVEYEDCLGDCVGCSGDRVYVKQKQTNQIRNASVAYQHSLPSGFIGQVHGAWFHEKLKGERSSDGDPSFIEYPYGRIDIMNLGLGYDLSNDFIKAGLGLNYRWGNAEGHFEDEVDNVLLDAFLAFGYKYAFLEGGSGIFWGSPTTGGGFFGVRLEADLSDQFGLMIRAGTTSIGPLHEVFSPILQATVRVPYIQASVAVGDFNGFTLGMVF